MPDPVTKLVDRALPATWPDDLAAKLGTTWRKTARRYASPARLRGIADQLADELRASFGDPERPRRQLQTRARTLLRDARPEREIRRALDAAAEELLAPLVERSLATVSTKTELLLAEKALAKDAMKLHRWVEEAWTLEADERAEIIEREECALGTALMLYWRGLPHDYRRYRTRRDTPTFLRAHWDLLRRIEAKMLLDYDEGGFLHFGIAFDPQTASPNLDFTDEGELGGQYPDLPAHVWIRTTTSGVEPLPR